MDSLPILLWNHDLLVIVPKVMVVISIALMVACPASALLFPKRKGDPIFRHDCL